MMKWHNITHPLPAFIHTFINLRDLPKCGFISVDGQKYMAGIHALVHSFSAIDIDAIEVPNTMIGKYTVDWDEPTQIPKLYIIIVISIDSPTIGIQYVAGSIVVDKEHQFLIRRLTD